METIRRKLSYELLDSIHSLELFQTNLRETPSKKPRINQKIEEVLEMKRQECNQERIDDKIPNCIQPKLRLET